MLGCAVVPRIGIVRATRINKVARLRISWWIHQTLHVAARGQHKLSVAAKKPGAAITCAPRTDVISQTGQQIHIDLNTAKVDSVAENESAIGRERVLEQQVEKIGMQCRRQTSRVAVPEQDVEGGRLI